MEVIYTGLHQTAEMIVETAIQEDVDVVGLSLLSGAHMTLFIDVTELLKKKGLRDQVKVLIGGAPISEEFAQKIGADFYCEDAFDAINKLEKGD